MDITLGPNSRAYFCLDCGQEFVWHPGVINPGPNDPKQPEGCGNCDSPNIQEIKPAEHE